MRDGQRIHRLAKRAIADQFACVQTPPTPTRSSAERALHVLVTSQRASRVARRLLRRTDSRTVSKVFIVSRRFALVRRRRIFDRLKETEPPRLPDSAPRLQFIDGPSADRYPKACEPIRIFYEGYDDQVRSWAHAAQDRYGGDRVSLSQFA